MFAVIKTGGKQYIVKKGDTLAIEKIAGVAGDSVTFDGLLLVGEEDGSNLQIGTPDLAGVSVTASILEQGRAAKIRVIKFKPKVRYTRRAGHRQPFTKIKIEKIG
jgi:large subunit ribosomal protein L21